MNDNLILGLLMSAVFLIFIAIVSFGEGATGLSIIQSPGSVEFPGYIIFLVIIVSIVGFVFIKAHHDGK